MTNEEILKLVAGITVWKRGGQRAPHKPLLVLYALGRALSGEGRMIPYSDIDEKLKKLLAEFGPTRKSYHPEYPFWRLQNDGIWELKNAGSVQKRIGNTDAKKSELLRYNVSGGLKEELYSRLIKDRRLLAKVVEALLDANFPSSIHEDILQAVGIDLSTDFLRPRLRDPNFRDRVLRAYEYRCAVCGFNVRIGNSLVALEAAHIKWHQAGGPDVEQNGIALCSLHHKLFDRGAYTISGDLQVNVSENAHGTSGFEEWLMAYNGKRIKPPQRPNYYPEPEFIHWHIREVFKEPGRYRFDNLEGEVLHCRE